MNGTWNFINAKNLPSTPHARSIEKCNLYYQRFEPQVRLRLAGIVSTQSVKPLGKLHAKISDRETRDAWWAGFGMKYDRMQGS